MNHHMLARLAQSPVVLRFHPHERRNVKRLGMTKPEPPLARDAIALPQDIAVLLVPWRVVHFGNHRLDPQAFFIVTIEEVQGAEVISKITQLGEQPNRPFGTHSTSFVNQLPNRLG